MEHHGIARSAMTAACHTVWDGTGVNKVMNSWTGIPFNIGIAFVARWCPRDMQLHIQIQRDSASTFNPFYISLWNQEGDCILIQRRLCKGMVTVLRCTLYFCHAVWFGFERLRSHALLGIQFHIQWGSRREQTYIIQCLLGIHRLTIHLPKYCIAFSRSSMGDRVSRSQ